MMLPSGGRSSLTSAEYYEKLKYFTWLANDHPRIACLMRHRPTRLHVPERHFWGYLLLHRLFIDRVLLLPTPPPGTPTDVNVEPSQRPARHKGSAYAHASPANGMCRRRRRIARHLECHQLFGLRCTVPTVPSISDADSQQRPDSRNPIGRCAHPEQRSAVPSQVVWPAGPLPVNPKVRTTRACVPHEALQCGSRHSFHLIAPAP